MIIILNNTYLITIDSPVTYILVIGHVMFGPSYYDLDLICIEFQMVSSGKVGYNI